MTQAFSRKFMFSPQKKIAPPSHPTCIWSKAQPNKNREYSALFMGFPCFFPTCLTVEKFFLPRGLWKLQTFRLHCGLWELDRRWAELDKTEGRGLDGWISRSCWCRVEGHLWLYVMYDLYDGWCLIDVDDDIDDEDEASTMFACDVIFCGKFVVKVEACKRNKVFFGGILEFRKHSKKTLRESTIDCLWCVEHFTCRLLPKTTNLQ